VTRDADSLAAEARRLDGQARTHKAAIARHRQALQQTRARQAEIERQIEALGIRVTHHHQAGAGDAPWPPKTRSSTSQR
jgi:hypothetical protein